MTEAVKQCQMCISPARFLPLAVSRSCKNCIARCCCWLFGWTAKRQGYQQKWYKLQKVLELS